MNDVIEKKKLIEQDSFNLEQAKKLSSILGLKNVSDYNLDQFKNSLKKRLDDKEFELKENIKNINEYGKDLAYKFYMNKQ